MLKGSAVGRVKSAVHTNLATAKAAPKTVLMTAIQEAEAARAAAVQAGYEEGLEQARVQIEAAMEDANRRVRRALAALCTAVESFDERQAIALTDVEDAIVAGAFGIAQAVVERELITATDPGADALARAMKLAPERGDVIARLNPTDVETLSMEDISTSTRTVRVVADATVEAGGCIVEVGETRVDAQLSTAFAHVKEALFGSAELAPEHTIEIEPGKKAAGRKPKTSRKTASEAPNE